MPLRTPVFNAGAFPFLRQDGKYINWAGGIRTREIQESKSCALPLGDSPLFFLLCYFLFLSICASIPLLNFFNDSASGRIFSGTFTSLALPPLFAISFSSIFLISDIFFCLVFCIFWQCSFSPCVIADLQTIHPHHGWGNATRTLPNRYGANRTLVFGFGDRRDNHYTTHLRNGPPGTRTQEPAGYEPDALTNWARGPYIFISDIPLTLQSALSLLSMKARPGHLLLMIIRKFCPSSCLYWHITKILFHIHHRHIL